MARFLSAAVFVLACLLGSGCNATHVAMHRAEQAYDQARFDHAATWLMDLEWSAPSMSVQMRARYYYLRGMTEFRLGHRLTALHYLAVAHQIVGNNVHHLREEQRAILDRTLAELTPTDPMSYRPPPPPE